MDYQPICDNPIDGSMSNGAGYRLCCNPKHQESPHYAMRGPVWHKITEWPQPEWGTCDTHKTPHPKNSLCRNFKSQ